MEGEKLFDFAEIANGNLTKVDDAICQSVLVGGWQIS